MAWIFAAVVLALVSAYGPGVRKVVLVVAGAVGALVLLGRIGEFDRLGRIGEFDRPFARPITQNNHVKKAPLRSPKRIPPEQIEIGDLRSNFEAEGGNSIDVRIHNNSPADTLASADYTILIDDCQGTEMEPSHCATVSDDKGTIVLEVPPREARDVTINAHGPYSVLTMLGHPRIRMTITAARAAAGAAKQPMLERASDGRIAEVLPDAQHGDGNR
jgi:hypothetical protein